MKFAFLLSGENVELAKWEVLQLANSYGKIYSFEIDDRLLIIDYEGKKFFDRLAMSHEVYEVLDVTESDAKPFFEKVDIPDLPTCVRVKGVVEDSMKLEKELGAVLWKRGAKISVSNPKVVFVVYYGRENCYLCKLAHVTDKKQFLARAPINRPFFMPSVVLPKFARTLVNLSGAKRDLLDPMCGTGSILIEAELLGLYAVGLELYKKIAGGCRVNLRSLGLKSDVIVGDATQMPFKDDSFEAIVTDYPYLRSTKTESELSELYEKSLEEFGRVLQKDCYAVLVSNLDVENYFKNLKLVVKLKQRVHGSLTRRIFVVKS
ncbi:MAG: methyltransferase domain-containing protein [Archaeoglobales archaeon]|nr:methyltransferase domain-containing protein [Archaeoglobales archaeon]